MSFDFLTEEVGAVESVKAASEIYTPVSGKVLEVNNALEEKPGLVNTSCYDQGWLFKIQIKDENEYEKLMSKEAYDNFLKTVKQ
jgi:glycine cleavage system H protein